MHKTKSEEIEGKEGEELAHGHRASTGQSHQSIVLLDSKALGLLFALWISDIALLKSAPYGATKCILSEANPIVLPREYFFSVPEALRRSSQTPQLGFPSPPAPLSRLFSCHHPAYTPHIHCRTPLSHPLY